MTENEKIYKAKRSYISIDLKSFYASVECKAAGKNPLTTNLVVAVPRMAKYMEISTQIYNNHVCRKFIKQQKTIASAWKLLAVVFVCVLCSSFSVFLI